MCVCVCANVEERAFQKSKKSNARPVMEINEAIYALHGYPEMALVESQCFVSRSFKNGMFHFVRC